MGKGDKKSKKGKIAMGSFGKSRPHRPKKHEEEQAKKK
jgi:30S ribosomal protein S31